MKHETSINVRFNETDALGHVNNTNYFVYLEDARIQLFQDLGFLVDPKGRSFVLVSAKCDYLKPAYFGDQLKIETMVLKIGNKSFQLGHRILHAETNDVIALGEVAVVYFNVELQKGEPLPIKMKEKLRQYLLDPSSAISES